MINFIETETPIQICDIGASNIEKTDFIDELLDNTSSRIIGFEPNKEEFEKLNKNDPKRKYYNFGIGDGTEKILNICKAVGMSSFLEPDLDYLKNSLWKYQHTFLLIHFYLQRLQHEQKNLAYPISVQFL